MATKTKLEAVEDSLKEAAAFQAKESNPFGAFEFTDTPPVVVKQPGMKQDATEYKRSKMIEGIQIQKKLWEDPDYTVERVEYVDKGGDRREGQKVAKIPRKWFTKSPTGKVVMECRYGQRGFEVVPGKKFVVLEDGQVLAFLNTLEEEVAKGTFDQKLLELGTRTKKDK